MKGLIYRSLHVCDLIVLSGGGVAGEKAGKPGTTVQDCASTHHQHENNGGTTVFQHLLKFYTAGYIAGDPRTSSNHVCVSLMRPLGISSFVCDNQKGSFKPKHNLFSTQ